MSSRLNPVNYSKILNEATGVCLTPRDLTVFGIMLLPIHLRADIQS